MGHAVVWAAQASACSMPGASCVCRSAREPASCQLAPLLSSPLSSPQIDVLLVEGQYYGFSGCHRFEAHQRLGLPTIRCRVRKATREVLKMHMM